MLLLLLVLLDVVVVIVVVVMVMVMVISVMVVVMMVVADIRERLNFPLRGVLAPCLALLAAIQRHGGAFRHY